MMGQVLELLLLKGRRKKRSLTAQITDIFDSYNVCEWDLFNSDAKNVKS